MLLSSVHSFDLAAANGEKKKFVDTGTNRRKTLRAVARVCADALKFVISKRYQADVKPRFS